MNALTQITTALTSRGGLPLDGHCACTECGKSGLQRDEINRINDYERVCDTCRPLYARERVSCRHCNDTGKVLDEVGHDRHSMVQCLDCITYEAKSPLPDADAYFGLVTA